MENEIEKISDIVILLREQINGLTGLERIDVISVLMTGYCLKCGEEEPIGSRCCCDRYD